METLVAPLAYGTSQLIPEEDLDLAMTQDRYSELVDLHLWE